MKKTTRKCWTTASQAERLVVQVHKIYKSKTQEYLDYERAVTQLMDESFNAELIKTHDDFLNMCEYVELQLHLITKPGECVRLRLGVTRTVGVTHAFLSVDFDNYLATLSIRNKYQLMFEYTISCAGFIQGESGQLEHRVPLHTADHPNEKAINAKLDNLWENNQWLRKTLRQTERKQEKLQIYYWRASDDARQLEDELTRCRAENQRLNEEIDNIRASTEELDNIEYYQDPNKIDVNRYWELLCQSSAIKKAAARAVSSWLRAQEMTVSRMAVTPMALSPHALTIVYICSRILGRLLARVICETQSDNIPGNNWDHILELIKQTFPDSPEKLQMFVSLYKDKISKHESLLDFASEYTKCLESQSDASSTK